MAWRQATGWAAWSLTTTPKRYGLLIETTRAMPGIGYVRVWLASGELAVGDDIMLVLIGGDIRPHVVDALQSLVGTIKNECVSEGRARGVRPRRQSESVYSESPPAVHVDLPAGFDVLELFCSGVCYTRVASLGLMVIL